MMFKKIIIINIILCCFFIQIADTLTITGEPTHIKTKVEEIKKYNQLYDNSISSEVVDLLKSNSELTIIINKNFDNDGFYLSEEEILVPVEFRYNCKYSKNITLIDIVDDDLHITDKSNYSYILTSAQDIVNFRENPTDSDLLLNNSVLTIPYNNNNDITILTNNKLRSGETLAYWYRVKSLSPGLFYINTIVADGNSFIAEHKSKIVVSNPEFNVGVKCRASYAYESEPIELEYNIDYIGDDRRRPICKNVKIELDVDPKFYEYIGIDNETDHLIYYRDLVKDKTLKLDNFSNSSKPLKIRYNNSGLYMLPGIIINDKTYNFKDEPITVNTPFQRNNLSFILSLILASIGTLSMELLTKETIYNGFKSKKFKNYLRLLFTSISILTILGGVAYVIYISVLQLRIIFPMLYGLNTKVLYILLIIIVLFFFWLYENFRTD